MGRGGAVELPPGLHGRSSATWKTVCSKTTIASQVYMQRGLPTALHKRGPQNVG